MKPKKVTLFLGRFEPYHLGHDADAKKAYESKADHILRIVGSVNKPRTIENPWDFKERELMLRAPLSRAENDRTFIYGVEDTIYNDNAWLKQIQTILKWHVNPGDEVSIVGGQKGEWYMKFFPEPQYKRLLLPEVVNINATQIRGWYFGLPWTDHDFTRHSFGTYPDLGYDCAKDVIAKVVPDSTLQYLEMFRNMPAYEYLCSEYEYYRKYWADNAKYRYGANALNFNTVDAILVQSGYILLVQRKDYPGKGLWALPGGFLNADEEIEDGMIRELREETHLKVAAKVLKGNIEQVQNFAKPKRSLRGRIITFGHYIPLPSENTLPKVKGGDDALKARWMPLSDISDLRYKFFEDHIDIIEHFVGQLSDRPIIIGDNPEKYVTEKKPRTENKRDTSFRHGDNGIVNNDV